MVDFTFIGIGNMGEPMVNNLLKKGFTVSVFDINKKIYDNFSNKKVIKLDGFESTKIAKNIITMLPDGKSLRNLINNKIFLKCLKKKSYFVDCSTADYETIVNVENQLKEKGVYFFDAPVSGGIAGAKNGTLTIMVGGDKKKFSKVKKILEPFGKNIIYIGSIGSGQIVKACNNMMLGINMIGLSEAFTLAKKYKIDKKILFNVCSKSTSSSWAMLNHLPVKGIVKTAAANKNFTPGYSSKLINKDLKIAKDMAKKVRLKLSLGFKASKLFDSFCKQGKYNLDYSAIIKILKIK